MVHRTSDPEILTVVSKVPPVALITEAPSTLLMNFIAADEVVSLYPGHLWLSTGLLTIPVPTDGVTFTDPIPALDNLRALGFSFVSNADGIIGDHLCGRDPSCPDIVREYPGHSLYSVPLLSETAYGSRVQEAVWKLRIASKCGSPSNASVGGWHFTGWQHRSYGEIVLQSDSDATDDASYTHSMNNLQRFLSASDCRNICSPPIP
ncbi:hypothetical protein DFP72DRAFT_1075041 [Ephemerocybe angulata]|uniref:Uncharacterized protein n=1 Tax=Ephemerocybe angulata TaxID=980116 RepID=A0A8H6HL91_9AGAR|nr:hypothetical protein DFP72DRAFT_1075041 [Tulosesus angulatus]